MDDIAASLQPGFSTMAIDGLGYEVILLIVIFVTVCLVFLSAILNTTNTDAPGDRFQLQARPANLQLDPCPICLEDSQQLAVQTSCGHHFCGPCFLTLWNDRVLNSVACPLCRQAVTILFPAFTADELEPAEGEQRNLLDQVLARVNRFNRYNSGRGVPLWDLLRDLPTLLPHLIADVFSPTGFSFIYMARISIIAVMCLAYLISPLDILPEAVFGVLGFLDDLVVMLLALIFVVFLYRNIVSRREFHA